MRILTHVNVENGTVAGFIPTFMQFFLKHSRLIHNLIAVGAP